MGCWPWEHGTTKTGYGQVCLPRNGGASERVYAHRAMFAAVNGYAPEVVRHSCHNPSCINPDHLLPGTHLDNVHDESRRRGRTVITDSMVLTIRMNQTLTQAQLARMLGIAQSTVSRIKRGLRRV